MLDMPSSLPSSRQLSVYNKLTNFCYYSYFVTELLGTDLHRLLTSRPLEKQFIQYFLYQILVHYTDLWYLFFLSLGMG